MGWSDCSEEASPAPPPRTEPHGLPQWWSPPPSPTRTRCPSPAAPAVCRWGPATPPCGTGRTAPGLRAGPWFVASVARRVHSTERWRRIGACAADGASAAAAGGRRVVVSLLTAVRVGAREGRGAPRPSARSSSVGLVAQMPVNSSLDAGWLPPSLPVAHSPSSRERVLDTSAGPPPSSFSAFQSGEAAAVVMHGAGGSPPAARTTTGQSAWVRAVVLRVSCACLRAALTSLHPRRCGGGWQRRQRGWALAQRAASLLELRAAHSHVPARRVRVSETRRRG